MLGTSFVGIVLRWDEGFVHFLMERKRGKMEAGDPRLDNGGSPE